MITFDYDEVVDLDDLRGLKLNISNTDNVDPDQLKAVLVWLGLVMFKRQRDDGGS